MAVAISPEKSEDLYARFKNSKDLLAWLNQDDQQGLKINIIRAVVLNRLNETNFLCKLSLGFQLHRPQILTYTLLLFFTALTAYFENNGLAQASKYYLRTAGVTWWVSAIWLYQGQIKRLSLWLEKTRSHYLSIHLPLFIWDSEHRYWRELPADELHSAFLGSYGVDAEKAITLTQSILLAIYLTSLGLL